MVVLKGSAYHSANFNPKEIQFLDSVSCSGRSETHKNQKNGFWKIRKIFNMGEIGKILIFPQNFHKKPEKPEKFLAWTR